MSDDVSDSTLRDWLLRRLPEPQTDALEERLMRDTAFAQRLREAEHDLFDDAARGRLRGGDAAAFERHWQATAGDRERLALARALAALQNEPAARPPRQRWVAAALAAALAASLAIAAGVGVMLQRPASGPAAPPPSIAAIPTLSLRATQLRGSGIEIGLPPAATALRLQAEITPPADAPTYVLSIAGERIPDFRAAGLPPRQAGAYTYVETLIPASHLRAGTLRVALHRQGIEDSPLQTWEIRLVSAGSAASPVHEGPPR